MAISTDLSFTVDRQYSRLDIAFSRFLAKRSSLDQKSKKDFELLVKELSYQQSQGHNCIRLNAGQQELMLASGLASRQSLSPLVIEENRLYLHRYWFYEKRLAQDILKICEPSYSESNCDALLSRYFIELIDETDWQREAAKKALCQNFCIITGGPGTGKTTTIIKILALIQELASNKGEFLHIALAAPTGKAAMRLQESIGLNKNGLPCSELIKQQIPESVMTLHRLLGARPPSPYFTHDSANPLSYDLIVIDEASMVDLALMSKVLDALKPGSKLILLGDKDQLASVESGAVLADLTEALPLQTVELKKSFRFAGEIKALADAVNAQDSEKSWDILENGHSVGLLQENVVNYAVKRYASYLSGIKGNVSFTEIFTTFGLFQILCSNRHGSRGVIEINQQIEASLIQSYNIRKSGQWYVGRPIMVTQNNPVMHLFNGDIGLCLLDEETSRLAVFFLCPNGDVKKIIPGRLPRHETVFAMTIHKSQGSEFDECLCVLADSVNPVLTKELVYTAITRAKTKLKIVSEYSIFNQTLEKTVDRAGGLVAKLMADKS